MSIARDRFGATRARFGRAMCLLVPVLALAALPPPASGQADRREDVARESPGQYPSARDRVDDARGWWIDLSVLTGFDSNPSLTTRDDPRDAGAGGFVGTAVLGFLRLHHSESWTLYATGSTFISYPWEIPDFSVVALRPNLAVDRRFQAFGLPMAASFGYGLDAVWVGGDFFNIGHALTWSLRVPVKPFFVVMPSYTLAAIDFKEDARDTVRHRIGIALRGPFRPMALGRAEWWLDYGYTRNNAGDLHAYDEHALSAGVALALRPGLLSPARDASSILRLGLGYAHRDYTRYPTSPARREDTVTLSGSYAVPIRRQLAGSIAVAHRIGDSNLAAFTTRRTTLTFALTWRF